MTHQHVSRTNQQTKSYTPLVSGILPRAAVRNVPEKDVQPTQEEEATTFRESRFHHNFCQVPASTGEMPRIQPKLKIGAVGDRYEQEADRVAQDVVQRINAPAQEMGDSLDSSEVQRPNKTSLPDRLKTGIEILSGYSLDDVRVHYNSSQPAKLNALAYAHGRDIYVAPGQESHLPHEAWHVVQQTQGRVQPTMQMKEGFPVNEDEGLEEEADRMGQRAAAGAMQVVRQKESPESKNADYNLFGSEIDGEPNRTMEDEAARMGQGVSVASLHPAESAQVTTGVQPMKLRLGVVQMVTKEEVTQDVWEVINTLDFKRWMWQRKNGITNVGIKPTLIKIHEVMSKKEAEKYSKEYKEDLQKKAKEGKQVVARAQTKVTWDGFRDTGETDFEKRFLLEHGDVIYGLREGREHYKKWVDRHYEFKVAEYMHPRWKTIDQYNNLLGIFARAPEQEREKLAAAVNDGTQRKFASEYLKQFYASKYAPPTDEAYKAMSPEEFAKTAKKEGQPLDRNIQSVEEAVKVWHTIRKSCKYALTNLPEALGSPLARVHFVLDGFTDAMLEGVVAKSPVISGDSTKGASIPITTSELRAIYRNWEKLKDRVYFYREGNLVKPPWETNKTLWDRYAQERAKKVKGLGNPQSSSRELKET